MSANSAQNAGGVKVKTGKTSPVVVKKAAKKPSADFNPFAAPGFKTNITGIEGVHDIYFVFRNDKAKPGLPLMSVSGIRQYSVMTANPNTDLEHEASRGLPNATWGMAP